MEQSFTIPARPWGEAEIKFLTANAHLLDEETRNELGLTRPEPVDDFKAELDTTHDVPVVETLATEPVVETPVVETPVVTPEVVTEPTVEGTLPTDTEGGVVDNPTTDNA